MTARRIVLTLAAALSLSMLPCAFAGEGHDHGDNPAAPNANGPQRLPDGSVFLPKPAQRQLGVRTLRAEEGALPRALELNGKVDMDPNAGGKVQPTSAGRIEPGPRGLPNPGQAVRKGEVLAYVVPSAAPIERSNQAAQLAELRAAKGLADKRAARLQELADTVPRKDIEAAESEARSLAERIAAVGTGLSTREALVAPVSGMIASANAVAGQVVDARELVFEVIDPARLRIEALAFDPAVGADIGSATRSAGLHRRRAQPARAGAAARLPRRRTRAVGAGRGPAGARLRAEQGHGPGHRGARGRADEEPGEPDHRLGEDRAGALRAAPRDGRAAGRRERGGHVGPRGRRPGGHARGHADQPGALKEPACSSGFSTTAWPTGCW